MTVEKIYFEKRQYPNSSCMTYTATGLSAAEIDSLPGTPEFLLPEKDFPNGKNAPVIGILLALEGEYYSIDEPYARAVAATGANIRLISYHNIEKQMENTDGVLLTGGCFPTPDEWSVSPPAEKITKLPPRTLAYQAIVGYAFKHNLPMLGICGGMQMIAGYLGAKTGFINKDILASARHHGINANEYAHWVTAVSGSVLAEICGDKKFAVNSMHREAVAVVADDKIKISARAEDGVIEGIEPSGYNGFALGVQWHPERMAVQGEEISRRLYQRLTDEAERYRRKKI